MSFIHLHVHSHYSLLDGLAKIDQLIAAAKKYNMKALALTDHGVMYGAIEFYEKAKKAGIKPIIGLEAYIAPQGRLSKQSVDEKPYHLVLLAKNQQGYKNLIKLTTIAHLEGFYYKPRIDNEVLEKYHQGLIALTACCQGEIPNLIINHQQKKAEEVIVKYNKLFGQGNFYLEVQHHPGIKEQKIVNEALFKLSKKYNVPLVATNDVHYINHEDAETQDILLCLQTKKKKKDKNRLCMLSDDFSFRSPEDMKNAFKDHPEAIENTAKIAKKCNLEIELGKTILPSFPLPDGKTPDKYLSELCKKNLPIRYSKPTKEVLDRLKYELSVIKKTGFASYFLIVQDFVNWAKSKQITVGPGRGSAAGSIVSYLLNITDVDPVKYGLIFERFLNGQRINPPDIDLDFADTRRDEVIGYVEEKYGKDHVAGIITFGTMAARAAIRDVGRVLDYPYEFCDKLAKIMPFHTNIDGALNSASDLASIYKTNKDAKAIIDQARKLEGVARHASRHACGIVITLKPLIEYTPLQYDTSGKIKKTIITQYEMHTIEDLGLLKVDFLGLRNLTLIETALKLIKYSYKKDIKINKIPLDDKKTFKLLQQAKTTGVFQLESEGMKRYLKQLKPTSLSDITAMVALYRPGPMQFIPEYIAGKKGKKIHHYLHPKLKPILEKTYGICVYQEQVLKIARDIAGFSLSEADVLRKAVGKKIPKLFQAQKTKFIKGCLKNGVSESVARKIFSFIEPFAGYAFNLAHATCYATIAYRTAYLKANYPYCFMAALMNSDQDDLDRVAIEVTEAKHMGIDVLLPDVNESYSGFTVVDKEIRFGLLAIKNVGEGIVKAIIKEREESGNFQNIEDFLSRLSGKELNKRSLEALIKSGAMSNFGEEGLLLSNVPVFLEFSKNKQRTRENGQKSLFSTLPEPQVALQLKEGIPISYYQKLLWEKEFLGLFISEHPLSQYKDILKKYVLPIVELKNNSQAKIVGIITKVKKVITSNKQAMAFVKVEDISGNIEVIVFPKIYEITSNLWQENKIIFISGRVSSKDSVLKLIAERVREVNKEKLDKLLLKS